MDVIGLKERLAKLRIVADGSVSLLEREPMARHTSFRIGGPAALMAVVHARPEGIGPLLSTCAEAGITPFYMGNGSDLLVSDEGFDGVIIKTVAGQVSCTERRITAEAGALLSRLSNLALDHALTGLEFAQGIPGSVGGGLMMNAGAYGGELAHVTAAVTCLDETGASLALTGAQCEFGYRTSLFARRRLYIARAEFALPAGDAVAIRALMRDLQKRRQEKQPLEYPSAGSAFKRPEGKFAAALIDECGLKGRRVGGAQVSEKHAGFIVNQGGATCRDVMTLIGVIQREVLERTGVRLVPEIKYLGGETAWNLS